MHSNNTNANTHVNTNTSNTVTTNSNGNNNNNNNNDVNTPEQAVTRMGPAELSPGRDEGFEQVVTVSLNIFMTKG